MEVNTNTTIKKLKAAGLISARTFHCLDAARLYTIKEVLDFIRDGKERLLTLRNFGRKSYEEVVNLLNKITTQRRVTEDMAREEAIQLTDIIAKGYEDTFSGEDDISNLVRGVFPIPESIRDAISGGEYDFLKIHEELGREGNIKLRNTYRKFVECVLKEFDERSVPHGPMYHKLVNLRTMLVINANKFSLVDDIEYFMSSTKRGLIERSYRNLSSRLSVRAMRILQAAMPTYRDVTPYFGKMLYEYNNLCPGQNMRKTLRDLYGFVSVFESDVFTIQHLTEEEAVRRNVGEMFPCLGTNQIEFVAQYWEENQTHPMFYVLYFYLKGSDDRLHDVYSLLNGIRDGEFHSLQEIGNMMHLTRERVRQLSVKDMDLQDTEVGKPEDWDAYAPLFALPYITELSPKYRMVKEEESLPFDFNLFSRLLPLVAPFKRYQVQGKKILVSRNLLQGWDLGTIMERIDGICCGRYTRDTEFRLQDFMEGVSDGLRDDAFGLLTYIISEAYGYQVMGDECFTIEQNRIDVAQEIYDILYKNGQPMHIEEIFGAFKNLYPEHRYADSRFLRPYIQKHPHIQAIGNTSTYALDSWDVYCGGVRDRLREILKASSTPMFIDDIVRKVLEVVPYTSRASILSTMDSSDFVSYKNDRWGLADKQYPVRFQRNQMGRQRKAFDERFDEFKEFVETYRRLPFSTGGENEEMLFRWINNVKNGIITTTGEQQEELESAFQAFREKHYPENTSEYKCLEKCNEYREYIEDNYELPTRQANEELYLWIIKMKRDYNGLTDNNRHYVTELFEYIRSYGFNL